MGLDGPWTKRHPCHCRERRYTVHLSMISSEESGITHPCVVGWGNVLPGIGEDVISKCTADSTASYVSVLCGPTQRLAE